MERYSSLQFIVIFLTWVLSRLRNTIKVEPRVFSHTPALHVTIYTCACTVRTRTRIKGNPDIDVVMSSMALHRIRGFIDMDRSGGSDLELAL